MLAFLDVHQGNDEFVATDARQDVLFAQCGAKTLSDLAQQLVAHLVSEGVVDRGEAVEVDDQQGAVFLFASCARQRLGEQLPEQRTVGQAGQAVVVDQVLHAFFGGAQHADVGENDEGVADGIGVVAHRADRD